MEVASRMKDPNVLLSALDKGRRWRTLKRRVWDWKRAQRFFMLSTSHPWPHDVAHVLEYLGVLMAEGVGHSVIVRFVHALGFMEQVGGVPSDKQLSRSPLVLATVDAHAVAAKSGTRPVKKAPQTPLAFISAMERLIVDTSQHKFVRAFAWYRLIRIWSGMRFDDHRGLLPSTLRLQSGALHGTLVRTKTTGAGRKQE